MQRRAPPWGAIEAFIAASRAGSFKEAAARLALSPAAFSRRIQALEDHVRVRLFDRSGQAPVLTVAGERYLQRLQPSFEAMRAATDWMAPDPRRRALRVGVSQSFAVGWLVPRLPRFYAQRADIELVLQTSADSVDLIGGAADIRILFGDGLWDRFDSQKLLSLDAYAVCAATLADGRAAPARLDQLGHYPLLELIHPANQWMEWLSLQGLPLPQREPQCFDSAMVMYEAVAQGLGIALGVSPLVDAFIDQGRVSRIFTASHAVSGGYYVAALPEFRRHEAVQIFWQWLTAEAARQSSEREGLRLVVSQ